MCDPPQARRPSPENGSCVLFQSMFQSLRQSFLPKKTRIAKFLPSSGRKQSSVEKNIHFSGRKPGWPPLPTPPIQDRLFNLQMKPCFYKRETK